MLLNIRNPNSNIAFKVSKPAIWLASYPRSGSAYVRSLIANYVSESKEPLSLQDIVNSTFGEHEERIYFELTGKQPQDRNLSDEMATRIAYFDRARELTNRSLPMIKTHTLFGAVNGYPTFKFIPGDRVIHLVRHPCDVAISFAHYYGIDIEAAIDNLLDNDNYYNGWPNAGYEVIGSWSQHTHSWMLDVGAPVYRIRYDDLVTRPVEMLLEIADFVGLGRNEGRASRAGRCQSNEERSPFGHTSIFEQNASGSKALPLSQGGRAASFEGLAIYEVAF